LDCQNYAPAMNTKVSVILAILGIVLAVSATLVTVSVMNGVAHADPFSWGLVIRRNI
jgi:hypothetical protein